MAINRLPDEVLGEILLLSMMPLGKNLWSSPELKTCHHWRRVAAERSPRIWSCLYITKRTPIECLDLWIARSAAAPLHVHLTTSLFYSDHFFQSVWKGITQKHSLRFWSLFLKLEGPKWTDYILPITFRVDNLRELRIHWGHSVHFTSRTVDIFDPVITPRHRLRMLEIQTSLRVRNIVMMPSFAASSLVELVVGEQAAPDVVCEFLRQCQVIQKLTWDLRHHETEPLWTPRPPRISIPTLERLWIAGPLAATFLLAADLPALRRLVVFGTLSQAAVCKAILEFAQITHLYIDFHRLDMRDVRSIFESLRNLEHLSYPWGEETLKAILALTEWSEGATGHGRVWHCPRMKRLHLIIGPAIASYRLQADMARFCLGSVMHVRAKSTDAPLDIIIDDAQETEQFAYIGVQRAPCASFPTV